MRLLEYDPADFPFAERVAAAFGVTGLETLHQIPELEGLHWLEAMEWCRVRVRAAISADLALYDRFVELICHRLGLDGLRTFQRPPTERVHLVGARTASALHRDRDHTVTTSPYLNAWVPLVDVDLSNALLVERDDGVLHPVPVRHGQVLLFDAYHRLHGSRTNTTSVSRVSFDLRLFGVDPVPYA